jgi:hypothetical protein
MSALCQVCWCGPVFTGWHGIQGDRVMLPREKRAAANNWVTCGLTAHPTSRRGSPNPADSAPPKPSPRDFGSPVHAPMAPESFRLVIILRAAVFGEEILLVLEKAPFFVKHDIETGRLEQMRCGSTKLSETSALPGRHQEDLQQLRGALGNPRVRVRGQPPESFQVPLAHIGLPVEETLELEGDAPELPHFRGEVSTRLAFMLLVPLAGELFVGSRTSANPTEVAHGSRSRGLGHQAVGAWSTSRIP